MSPALWSGMRRMGWLEAALRGNAACGWALCGWLSGACAPLTISREAAIDFERYPDVVVVVASARSDEHTAYLVDELAGTSGFELVTADDGRSTSARLEVTVVVTERVDVDSDGDVDTSYDGEARYRLIDAQTGELVDSGEVDDTSQSYFEAFEDVLDEIALHYFRPFRV